MKFEKWQALGNDYIVLEAADLPWELNAPRVRRLCERHVGVDSDGVLLLSEPDKPGFVARLRIFNPDGSEAELSGNGARQAVMYLRERGWTDSDTFSIQTEAGEIQPTITGPTTCRIDLGPAAQRSKDFPSGDDTGAGTLNAGGREWRFQHVSVGNPQCAIALESPALVDDLNLGAAGPGIEAHELFPNRTNVSWFAERAPGTIRARIFERGVGETLSSGTGASGAAVAYVLQGGQSPVTVVLDGGELQVDVGEDLRVTLTGWAVPVYRAELAESFIEELRAAE